MTDITTQFTEEELMDFGRIMERDGFSSIEQLVYEAAIQYKNSSLKKAENN
jgi:hypothetical protein